MGFLEAHPQALTPVLAGSQADNLRQMRRRKEAQLEKEKAMDDLMEEEKKRLPQQDYEKLMAQYYDYKKRHF